MKYYALLLLVSLFMFASCDPEESAGVGTDTETETDDDMDNDTDDDSDSDANAAPDNDMLTIMSRFYNSDAMTISYDDDYIYITTNDIPDHNSMYFETTHPQYEEYTEPDNPDFKQIQNSFIEEQNYVFTIPRFPEEQTETKSSSAATPTVGVALNGVIFNSGNEAIISELNTFDQYEGHPEPFGFAYHYHIEPTYLVETQGEGALMGIMLDGFPIYGMVEDGVELTADDLDEYHGKFGPTEEFPDGIYHYRFTDDVPWLTNDEFYGVVGTVSN